MAQGRVRQREDGAVIDHDDLQRGIEPGQQPAQRLGPVTNRDDDADLTQIRAAARHRCRLREPRGDQPGTQRLTGPAGPVVGRHHLPGCRGKFQQPQR